MDKDKQISEDDFEKVYNANSLIASFRKCSKGTIWKESVQRYEANLLLNTYDLQQQLKTKTYKQKPPYEFDLHDRGKVRHIKALAISDRVVQRSVCDNLLLPTLRPLLIYDNGASLKGKGIDFTRQRLYTHLEKYYKEYGTNEGYILLVDYSKYFDNIRHDTFLRDIKPYFSNNSFELIEYMVQQCRVDVSYMSEEEYEHCLDGVFNSLEYESIDKSLLTGEKFMAKSMGIGSPVSQIAGVFYPHKIDNYCKVVRGIKYYGRYEDDTYVIGRSKEFLAELLKEITKQAAELGITVNAKKTRIMKLTDFEFLKLHYSLKADGDIKVRTTNETFRRHRRKLPKWKHKLDSGEMGLEDIVNSHKSWKGSVAKYGNHYRIEKCDKYFNEIFNDKELNKNDRT